MRFIPSKIFCVSLFAFTFTFAISAHAQYGVGTVTNQPSQVPITNSDTESEKNDVTAKSSSDFFNNLKNCDQLTNKAIIFQTNKSIIIRIYASDSAFCHIESLRVKDQAIIQKASCEMTKAEVDEITSPKSLAIVQQYELTRGNSKEVLDIFSKLLACLTTNTQTEPTQTQSPSNTPSVQQPNPNPSTTYDYGKQLQ